MSEDLEGVRVPRHVAVIMDGNGRWAASRGLPRAKGHEAGADSVREVVRECRALGVEALTLYSFSTENWKRPQEEVDKLMALLERYLVGERDEILGNAIRFRAIGQLDRLPGFVRRPLELLTAESSQSKGMTLCLALSYGARMEITEAVKQVAREVASGMLAVEDIDEAVFSAHLYTAELPDPDLLIRTSGEMRLSNFLLWQVAYAELYVTEVHWPDFRRPHLLEAFRAYGVRERRYGRTTAQLASDEDDGG